MGESALTKIFDLTAQIQDDSEKDTKAAKRRARVALSEVSKLCKLARADLLAEMKEK